MWRTPWPAAALPCLGYAGTANGAGIIGITLLIEFRTQATTPASESASANGLTFTIRFAGVFATRVNADGELKGAQDVAQVSSDLSSGGGSTPLPVWWRFHRPR